MQARLGNLGDNSIIAQWVPATDAATAEKSFFKINQAATPIDATESRILKSRKSARAIAARAITHAGTGHKYWSAFDEDTRERIEAAGKDIYHALYDPPLGGRPLTTLDVPVAGRGYNALPFVFDLVNHVNGVDVADTTVKRNNVRDVLPTDTDGTQTMTFLRVVQKRLSRLTGDSPSALGLHPVVYFYTRGGSFQPTAFLATSLFIEELADTDRLIQFTDIRAKFEAFLVEHKEALGLLTHKFGSGVRSLPWIRAYMTRVAADIWRGMTASAIQEGFKSDPDFAFLTLPRPSANPEGRESKPFSANTKTAAFFAAALSTGTKCKICGGLVHRNSVQFDHKHRASDGGTNDFQNAQVTHPFCNSTYKERQVRLAV